MDCVRLTQFRDLMNDEFGAARAAAVARDHLFAELGDRTVEQALEAGDVVTVEPGVYIPGRFGVRIEDLVTVTADGCRNFSGISKDLRAVA